MLLVVGAGTVLLVRVGNTGHSIQTPVRAGRPQVYRPPKTVHLTPAERYQAFLTASSFIETAVLRRHLADSWKLAAPSFRQGYTLADWKTGNIPVVPFPAVGVADWKVDYSFKDRLGLEVVLLPKAGSHLRARQFQIGLQATGKGKRRHWLVDSWAPSAGPPDPSPETTHPVPPPKTGLDARWLLVPVGLFGFGLLAAVGLLLRNWYRGVRARRAYTSSLSPS